MSEQTLRSLAAAAALAALASSAFAPIAAAEQTPPGITQPPSDVYDVLYARYLNEARRTTVKTEGPSIEWMATLGADPRARRVNDLVTIRVLESIEAAGTADAQLDKSSSGSASVPKLFGLETKLPSAVDPSNLASTASDTRFKGGGVTTRTGELTAMMTARVVEVLPNGDLVLEGAREIEINGDRQIVVLSGVARTADINRDNTVLSTAVGQLRIRYFGRGLMKDNLKPGWLIRVLNKIF